MESSLQKVSKKVAANKDRERGRATKRNAVLAAESAAARMFEADADEDNSESSSSVSESSSSSESDDDENDDKNCDEEETSLLVKICKILQTLIIVKVSNHEKKTSIVS